VPEQCPSTELGSPLLKKYLSKTPIDASGKKRLATRAKIFTLTEPDAIRVTHGRKKTMKAKKAKKTAKKKVAKKTKK
jgi:hypothetical protein